MKQIIVKLALTVIFMLLLTATCNSFALSQDDDFAIIFDAAVRSKYLWRGLNLVDDFVFQPSVGIVSGGFYALIWGSMEMMDANNYSGFGEAGGKFTEYDLAASYSWEMADGLLFFAVGIIHLEFPNTGFDSTTEAGFSVGFNVPLQPTLTWNREIVNTESSYFTLSFAHFFPSIASFHNGKNISLELSGYFSYAMVGYNEFYYLTAANAFADAMLTLSFPAELSLGWRLTPSVNYSTLLNTEIRKNFDRKDNLWFGLSISLTR